MSESKKTFFESLDPKSALVVGLVGGLLVIGTIGFVVLGTMALRGGVNCGVKATTAGTVSLQTPTGDNTQDAQPAVQVSAPKADKPVAEVFVMSYCPYGIQMEQAVLPVMDLLKNKADISVKFVSYAMHGLKEVEENTRQYCIQKDQPSKFVAYLKCFVGSQDYASCLNAAGVNKGAVDTCVASANKQFGIMDKYNDQTTWLSGRYPIYPIHEDLNQKYGVEGSPTFILNGAQVNVGRTPEAVKQAICSTFNKAPSECATVLAGAGAATAATGGCGE